MDAVDASIVGAITAGALSIAEAIKAFARKRRNGNNPRTVDLGPMLELLREMRSILTSADKSLIIMREQLEQAKRDSVTTHNAVTRMHDRFDSLRDAVKDAQE